MDTRHVVRRRPTPVRSATGGLVVASRRTGDALVLAPTAARVWGLLADWTDVDRLAATLVAEFPQVDDDEVHASVTEILEVLDREDLLNPGAP